MRPMKVFALYIAPGHNCSFLFCFKKKKAKKRRKIKSIKSHISHHKCLTQATRRVVDKETGDARHVRKSCTYFGSKYVCKIIKTKIQRKNNGIRKQHNDKDEYSSAHVPVLYKSYTDKMRYCSHKQQDTWTKTSTLAGPQEWSKRSCIMTLGDKRERERT